MVSAELFLNLSDKSLGLALDVDFGEWLVDSRAKVRVSECTLYCQSQSPIHLTQLLIARFRYLDIVQRVSPDLCVEILKPKVRVSSLVMDVRRA